MLQPDHHELSETARQQLASVEAKFNQTRSVLRDQITIMETAGSGDLPHASHMPENASAQESLSVASCVSVRLAKTTCSLQAAQLRILQGTYGKCRDCQGEISKARLEAVPEAERCGPCQAKFDGTHLNGRH